MLTNQSSCLRQRSAHTGPSRKGPRGPSPNISYDSQESSRESVPKHVRNIRSPGGSRGAPSPYRSDAGSLSLYHFRGGCRLPLDLSLLSSCPRIPAHRFPFQQVDIGPTPLAGLASSCRPFHLNRPRPAKLNMLFICLIDEPFL